MSYFTAIEKSLAYIEKHLCEDIDLSSIAREAGYSLYHFHRIFRGIVGDSIKEYIRKRRMTEAAKELASTDKAVIDIAIKYGYQSREAFSGAFEKAYGKRPSQVKRDEVTYSIREPMTLDYMIFQYKMRKNGINPIFRRLPERTVVGKKFKMKLDGSNYQRIPLLWEKWKKENSWTDIKDIKYSNEYMGICMFSEDTFDYIIGQEVNDDHIIPSKMTLYKIKQLIMRYLEP